MFLPLNETEFNGEKSFLNGLLDVLDFSVRSCFLGKYSGFSGLKSSKSLNRISAITILS